MPHKKTGKKPQEPMIRFGGEWVPAHDLWKKMETANVVADAIERFNTRFPELASSDTRDVVPLVRQRLKHIELSMPDREAQPDLAAVAVGLLETLSPEDAVETLKEKHGMSLDIGGLVQLVGEKAYRETMAREASEYEMNRISPDQTAELWNDASRPAPGGGLWTAKKVSALLAGRS